MSEDSSHSALEITTLVCVLLILLIAIGWTIVAGRQVVLFRQLWPRLEGLTLT